MYEIFPRDFSSAGDLNAITARLDEHDTNGAVIPPNPAWTDVAGLDYSKPVVRRYMIDMMKYWLQDFGVDGFRCDVGPNVPLDFWEAARTELEKLNPQVIILADAGAKPELLTKAFDVDSSWGLVNALNSVMSSVTPASYLKDMWEHNDQQFPKGALHLRFSDSHEEIRAVARYGVTGALAAQVLMLTLDSVPLFYNGMEVGDATESADPALFEKAPVLVSGRTSAASQHLPGFDQNAQTECGLLQRGCGLADEHGARSNHQLRAAGCYERVPRPDQSFQHPGQGVRDFVECRRF